MNAVQEPEKRKERRRGPRVDDLACRIDAAQPATTDPKASKGTVVPQPRRPRTRRPPAPRPSWAVRLSTRSDELNPLVDNVTRWITQFRAACAGGEAEGEADRPRRWLRYVVGGAVATAIAAATGLHPTDLLDLLP